jgi:O-antigen ligase
MRKLTGYLLWAFVFTTPWDNIPLPFVGTVSRAFGLAAVGAAILTTAMAGRFRKPDAVLAFAIAFSVWGALSLLWTISYRDTVPVVTTLGQLVVSVWMLRELVRTRRQIETLLTALCLGMFVPLTAVLNNFRLGAEIREGTSRFTGVSFNADTVGVMLVFGLPIAWHLFMHHRGIVRVASLIYLVIGPVGLLLTATRGAFVAAIAAAAIVPLTLRSSLRSYSLAGVLLILGTLFAALLVPQANWERMLSTSSEITEGGTMSGRIDIWKAGLQTFPERPFLGAGPGTYGQAVAPYIIGNVASHNTALGLLVERGIVGLILFAALLGACTWTILRSPPPHRALWGVLILAFLVGGITGDDSNWKITWVFFGLISAQSGLRRTVGDVLTIADTATYTTRTSLSGATI